MEGGFVADVSAGSTSEDEKQERLECGNQPHQHESACAHVDRSLPGMRQPGMIEKDECERRSPAGTGAVI